MYQLKSSLISKLIIWYLLSQVLLSWNCCRSASSFSSSSSTESILFNICMGDSSLIFRDRVAKSCTNVFIDKWFVKIWDQADLFLKECRYLNDLYFDKNYTSSKLKKAKKSNITRDIWMRNLRTNWANPGRSSAAACER